MRLSPTRLRILVPLAALLCVIPAGTGAQTAVERIVPALSDVAARGVDDRYGDLGFGVDVGYLSAARDVALFARTEAPYYGRSARREYAYPLTGVWIELMGRTPLREGFHLAMKAAALLPADQYASLAVTDHLGVDVVDARTVTRWYAVDATLVRPVFGVWALFAGFRFDSFETRVTAEIEENGKPPTVDESAARMYGYLPLVGLTAGMSGFRFTVSGFPWAGGDVAFSSPADDFLEAHTHRGRIASAYFIEADGRYVFELGAGSVGFFAEWQYLHADALSASDMPVTARTRRMGLSFERGTWTVGASASLRFDVPL